MVLDIIDTDLIGYGLLLLLVTGVIDVTGIVLAFAPRNRTVRSIGWGVLIAFLTHIVAGSISLVVLFGWCVSLLTDHQYG